MGKTLHFRQAVSDQETGGRAHPETGKQAGKV